MVGQQIRKFVTMSESRKCLSEERDLEQGATEVGLSTPQAALDFTLDFEGLRIQASWSLEAARTISSHSCHVDRGLRSKTREVTNSFAPSVPFSL